MKTVAFHTLGCKVNQYETEAITEQFLNKGYSIKEFEDMADVYVVNTCTVTNIADKKSRKMLSKAKKNNPEAVVVAVGCYVQVAHEQLGEVPFIDVLIGNTHKDQVVQIVEEFIKTKHQTNHIENVHKDIAYEELSIHFQQTKTRSTIKIQDGCNQYCTYCIIPYTRGKVRSRQLESVIEEVKELASKGYHEIILTGIHLASYGKDLKVVDLISLIESLNRIEGIQRIRLGSLEPNLITLEFIERLKLCQKVCDHFHLSMQSGSDTVLERMKRRYDSSQYYDKVQLIRQFYKNPAITTDIIVGFPMETNEEANETYEFVKMIGFSELHVFKYSIREGTKAALMKPQVDGVIKNNRSKQLSELGDNLRLSYLESYLNTQIEVLFEEDCEIDAIPYKNGYTSNYIKVYIDKSMMQTSDNGNICAIVELKSIFQDGIKGTIIE